MKRKLISSLLILIFSMCALCTQAFAEEIQPPKLAINITGAKDGKILVYRGDSATGTPIITETVNGSDQVTIDLGSYVTDVDVEYVFTIVQQAGTTANANYDTTTYRVGAIVYYPPADTSIDPTTNGSYDPDYSKKQVAFVLKKNDEDDKPGEVRFDNSSEETITLYRDITYTENTVDGPTVHPTHNQSVTLKRKCTYDPATGTYIYSDWEIVSGDQSAVTTPDHPKKSSEGWEPNTPVVPAWDIDLTDSSLKDGNRSVVHVVYTKPPVTERKVTTDEYKTVTRTITYTKYTKDGKKVSRTVIQTVTLKRTRTDYVDENGNVISGKTFYTKWQIVSGDTNAVKTPDKSGWKPNMKKVGKWDIDLDNPQDAEVNVIYVPTSGTKDKTSLKDIVKTGDPTTIGLWVIVLVLTSILLAGAVKKRRRKQQ